MSDTTIENSEEVETQVDINDLLQVRIEGDENGSTHFSRVSDISEGKLIITWPTYAGIRLLTHRDQMLAFTFVRDSVPHKFSGMVDDMSAEGLPLLTIIQCSTILRIQRRQNFRVKCMIPLEIAGTLKDAQNGEEIPLLIRTATSDISAGGLGFRHAKPIPEDAAVEAKLALPDDAPAMRLPCRVVHSDSPTEHQNMFRMGIIFLAIGESERARIVRYVYRTQLKGLRP